MDQPTLSAKIVSKITEVGKQITHQDSSVADGLTAMAQKHLEDNIDSKVLHDITAGEKTITRETRPVAGGPTAAVQSHISKCANGNCEMQKHHDGELDAETVGKITAAEKKITHEIANVNAAEPTAKAQKHVGEDLNIEAPDYIAEGEIKNTGDDCPVTGDPTAVAQSELSKSRM